MHAHLVIADIGGYTNYMNMHRLALSHAQQVIADLLSAMIDGAKPMFKVAKLEGDAAFLWAVEEGKPVPPEVLERQILKIREAFLHKQQQMCADNICTCDPCQAIGNLKLKFAAHTGEVAVQKVKRFRELAGPDVILVHRMLKNDVPSKEYVLMSPQMLERLDSMQKTAKTLQQSFEGFGEVTTHYLDFSVLPPPQLPEVKRSKTRQLVNTITRTARSLPILLGLSQPTVGDGSHEHV